jgi:uncharacterized membrane protein
MKHSILAAIKKGLFALTPLVITIALIRWIYETLEHLFGSFFEMIVGKNWYFPGLGVLLALSLLIVVGYLLDLLIIQKVYHLGEKLLVKIPFVKTLYGSIRQFMSFFKSDERKMGQAVRVNISGVHMIGIMTQSSLKDFVLGKVGEVSVFLPMSYQMGGYTVLIKKEFVEILDMKVEEVLKFAVTAGVLSESKESSELH